MKTIGSLREQVELLYYIMAREKKTSKEFKAAKRKVDFLSQCIALIESGLNDEIVHRKLKQMKEQYARMKTAFFEEFTKEDPETGKIIKPKISRFHKESGAGKIRTQMKTFEFLQ